MNDREKLAELIKSTPNVAVCKISNESLADHLIANGVTVQRWIPVTERLPESSDQTVMIARSYRGKRYVEIGAIFANGEACCYSDEYKIHPREHLVTHWMPLPEPPKGE